jgi:hypothetical protein
MEGGLGLLSRDRRFSAGLTLKLFGFVAILSFSCSNLANSEAVV